MKNKGLCHNCVRFHPKAKGNCVWANSWMGLERKHGYKLAVMECSLYAPVEEVFPEPKSRKTKEEPKQEPDVEGEEEKVE